MDPIATARMGMMFATNRLEQSAGRVAQMGFDSDVDYVSETVEQISAKQAFTANVQVVKIADQMWQSLLDIQKA